MERHVQSAQMAVGGAQWVDQEGLGISPIQRARNGKSARRVGLGVPGVEPAADVWTSK